jgi:enoyl-CoA hydratase/carnithine racemase
VAQDGHVAWLTQNRPDNQNIMGFAFFEGFAKHFGRFDEDSSVREAVIKAEAKSFTAGLACRTSNGSPQIHISRAC